MSKVERNQINIEKCVCADCSSYNECAKNNNKKLFCANDPSNISCDFEPNGCICGGCIVHDEYNLDSGYYCINGPSKQA